MNDRSHIAYPWNWRFLLLVNVHRLYHFLRMRLHSVHIRFSAIILWHINDHGMVIICGLIWLLSTLSAVVIRMIDGDNRKEPLASVVTLISALTKCYALARPFRKRHSFVRHKCGDAMHDKHFSNDSAWPITKCWRTVSGVFDAYYANVILASVRSQRSL